MLFGDAHGFRVGAEDRGDGIAVGVGVGAGLVDGVAVVVVVVEVFANDLGEGQRYLNAWELSPLRKGCWRVSRQSDRESHGIYLRWNLKFHGMPHSKHQKARSPGPEHILDKTWGYFTSLPTSPHLLIRLAQEIPQVVADVEIPCPRAA